MTALVRSLAALIFLTLRYALHLQRAGVRTFDNKDGFVYGVNHAYIFVRHNHSHGLATCQVGDQ